MHDKKSYSDRRVSIEQNAQMLSRAAATTVRNMQIAKSAAYRMAVDFIAIQGHHLAELQKEIETRWPGERDGIDKWIAEEFRPYIAVGGDPYELFRAIREGVSMKEFLALPFALPLNKKIRVAVKGIHATAEPPAVPSESLTTEQQLAMWKARAMALEQQVKALRPLQGQVELLRRKLQQMQAVIGNTSA